MILSYEPSISLHVQTQRMWLAVPDMNFHVTCRDLQKYGFYKLNAATRLPHWLPYIRVSYTYDNKRTIVILWPYGNVVILVPCLPVTIQYFDGSTKFTFQLNLQNEFNKLVECHTQLTDLRTDTCCNWIGAVQADQLSNFLQVKFVWGNFEMWVTFAAQYSACALGKWYNGWQKAHSEKRYLLVQSFVMTTANILWKFWVSSIPILKQSNTRKWFISEGPVTRH